jgi:hypothetical protein
MLNNYLILLEIRIIINIIRFEGDSINIEKLELCVYEMHVFLTISESELDDRDNLNLDCTGGLLIRHI